MNFIDQPSIIVDTIITGTAGDDRLDGSDSRDLIRGLGGDDFLQGFGGDDVLGGATGDDTLLGGSGDDTLNGASGYNSINGGSGDDFIVVADAQKDQVEGGSGWDTVTYQHIDHGVFAPGYLGVEEVIGTAFDDELELVAGGMISGGAGNDNIFGSLAVGSTAVRAHGQAGDDTLTAGSAADTLSGNAGNDTFGTDPSSSILAVLKGGKGDDTFMINAGDTIEGGSGRDVVELFGNGSVITGGSGSDRFIIHFFNPPDLGPGLITDLEDKDRIDLSQYNGDRFTIVDDFDGHHNEARLVYDAGTNETQLQLDVNGDGEVDAAIRMSGDHTDFTNFIL